MRMIILGAPGAGKGTQARAIAETFGIPAISTGEIFRANIKQGTELGQRVQSLLDAGELVPDELTNEIVADRLAQPDAAEGFLLDGYPRNLGQVQALDELLAQRGTPLDVVLEMTCEEEAVIQRLLHRAEVEGRADDTEDVIRHRMEVYHQQTEPLTDAYRAKGILMCVDGMGDVDAVAARIAEALAPYRV